MYNPISLKETWHIYKNNKRLHSVLFEMDNTLELSKGGFKGCLPSDVTKVRFEPNYLGRREAGPDYMVIQYAHENDMKKMRELFIKRGMQVIPTTYDGRSPLSVYIQHHEEHEKNKPDAVIYRRKAEVVTDGSPNKVLSILDEYSSADKMSPTTRMINRKFNESVNKVALDLYMHEREGTTPLTYDQIAKDTGVTYQGVLSATSFLFKKNLVELKDNLSKGINIHRKNEIKLTTEGINQVEILMGDQLKDLENYIFNV